MAKVTPTTKSCNEICRLITGYDCSIYSMYVQPTYDHVSTHALYGVHKNDVDHYKGKIKAIGGKYIRVVKGRDKFCPAVICFALEITEQERVKQQIEADNARKYQAALESKIQEIKSVVECMRLPATCERGQRLLASYLLQGKLDTIQPFESYILLDDPKNKDEKRIYDIVRKANDGYSGCLGLVTIRQAAMIELASRMNRSITDEDKRLRRKAACLKYGLKFLASCFESSNT